MKKLFFGLSVLIAGWMTPAHANDSCCPYQYNPCCDGNFDGFYVGGNLGVLTDTAHRNDNDGFLTDRGGWTLTGTNFTIGGQVGYDWLCRSSLFGLVVDFNWVNVDNRHVTSTTDEFINNKNNYFTTIRGRFGVTICDALLYLTGGAAVARFDTHWSTSSTSSFHHTKTHWGWAGGVGAEFLVWCNWSLGFELLFVQFSNYSRTETVSTTTFHFTHSDNIWMGRILLNYRFGDLCSCWCR